MKLRLTILFMAMVCLANADQTIFPLNSVWKYLDNGTNQGTAWRDSNFSDASWSSGNAKFGYGEGDESTIVSFGPNAANKFVTTYFRKSFNITNVAAFTAFELGVRRDDGVVVYVNGVEAWRDNINGTISYLTLAASDAADDGNSVLTANIPASLFVTGNNVIAVEIHQFVVNSSDLSFDLRLTGLETPPPTNVTIFPLNSVWKYLDNGTNQGTAWRDVAFSDATWASGPGEFGYGDGDESTVVSYGSNASNKFITTYFRKTISIADISAFTSMQLGIKRDDGVVVYVNGVEVWRDNINGVVTYTTLAANDAADDGSSLLTANIPTSYFVNGTNVIAVEIHQFVANSSDLSFDMSLTGMGNTPPAIPSVVIGSYLNVATPTSIIVRYRTDISAMSKIVYGTTSGIFTDSAVSASPVTEHIVQLSGLQPNTKYYYAVKSGNNFLQNDPAENYFITPPVAGTVKPTRIWVLGDMGFGSVEQNQVRDAYYNYTGNTYTDLWLWLGDNAYNSGTDAEYQNNVFNNRYEKMLRQTVVWPAAGNHEMYASNAVTETGPYYELFNFPTNGEAGGVPSGKKAYYSYNYANIHFIVLESTTASFRTIGGAMMNWLQADLAANTQKWTVVYFHHPPYSMGSHNSDTETELIEMRQNFVPILEQYKVDLVLTGHSHNYERSFFIKNHFGSESTFNNSNLVDGGSGAGATPYIKSASSNFQGTVYAVAGTGGILEGTSPGWPHNAMYSYSSSTYGSMVLDINGDTLYAKFIDNTLPNPTIYDQFTIIKQCDQQVTLAPYNNVCSGQSAFALAGGSPSGGTYSGIGVSNGVFDPSVAGIGTHTITYTYTNGFCSDSATSTITVTTGGQIATISPSGNITLCQNDSVILSANSGIGLTYQWQLNGSDISGATSQSYTANGAGNYTVAVTSSCGTVVSSATIVGAATSVSISPSGSVNLCSGPVTLAANTGVGYTYQWKNNGVDINGATNSSLEILSAGSYSVLATDSTGCASLSNVVTATGSSHVISALGATDICAGSKVMLSAQTGTGFTFQWYRNNGAISGATGSSYNASSHGNYYCRIVAPGCVGNSNTIVVTVINNPTPTISANGSLNVCSGSSVILSTNTFSGVSYQWERNGSAVNGATSQLHTTTLAGTYRVTQTANGCSKKSPAIAIKVVTGPTATITANGSVNLCNGQTVTLNANIVSGATYQWLADGVDIAGATNQSFIASTSGNYQCRITTTCAALSNIVAVTASSMQISISPSTTQTVCQGNNVLFSTSNEPGNNYQWNVDGNAIPGAISDSYSANVSGVYSVTITNGCGTQTSQTVTVNVVPVTATISPDAAQIICSGGSVNFTANTGFGNNYQWNLNGNPISGAISQTFNANVAGNYSVTISNSCGVYTSASVQVSVGSIIATISPDTTQTICSGDSVLLTANPASGISYQWYLDGNTIVGANASTYYAKSQGNYTVSIVSSCGNSTSPSVALTVISLSSSITPATTQNICPGSFILLSANTGNGLSYQWKKDGIIISGATQATFLAEETGIYTVDVSNSCGSLESNQVTVNAMQINASVTPVGTTTVCSGTPQTFSVLPTIGATYQWYRNNVAISNATNNSFNASSSGQYYVKVHLSGCNVVTSNTAILSVQTNTTPTVTVTPGTTLCNGQQATLSSNIYSGVAIQWQHEKVNIPGATSQTYQTSIAGQYRVVHTYNGCVRNSAEKSIKFVSCRSEGYETDLEMQVSAEVFPNPFKEVTNIKLNGFEISSTTITVTNILGEMVHRFHPDAESIGWKRDGNAPGIYLMQITDGYNHRITQKIVIE